MVTDELRRIDWLDKQVCVACSGGVDSMVLLQALVSIGKKPAVLHVNYQLRGKESDLDEALVMKTAESLGLTYEVHHCPTEITKAEGGNLQAAARDFRRKLFGKWTSRSEQHVVALAHHLDDQLETFFLQYFRGSGLFGLGGMHPEKGQIVRPFLSVPKADIITFALENRIPWREDSSNESGTYLRNIFRNRLLPELKKAHPGLAANTALIMKALRDLQADVTMSIQKMIALWKTEERIVIADWRSLSDEQQLAFVHAVRWPVWTIDRLNELVSRSDGKRVILKDFTLVRRNANFHKLRNENEQEGWDFKSEKVEILPEMWSKEAVYLDPGKLDSPLQLRRWQAGDRIKSLGMKGSQLVSDILKDAGIPLSRRAEIRVLATEREILWVPGLKVSRIALATPESEMIWRITIRLFRK